MPFEEESLKNNVLIIKIIEFCINRNKETYARIYTLNQVYDCIKADRDPVDIEKNMISYFVDCMYNDFF